MVLEFARLADKQRRTPRTAVGVDGGQPSADKRRRIPPGLQQDLGEQARGGGLAVRARDRDRAGIAAADHAEQLRTLEHRQTAPRGFGQLRVVGGNGCRVDDQLGVAEVLGIVTDMHGNRELSEPDHIIGSGVVRSGDRIAERMQYLGERAHARSADADKVNAANAVQNGRGGFCHASSSALSRRLLILV